MNKNAKIALVVGGVVVLGVGGFFLVRAIGNKKPKGSGTPFTPTNTSDGGGSTPSSSTSSSPTSAQIALAKDYRLWANSTDALSKKYGKKSSYDLDKTSSNPYNSYFKRSYAVGQGEYEAWKAGGGSNTSSGSTSSGTYNSYNDRKALLDAMKGIGTDESAVDAIISKLTQAQRQQLAEDWDSKKSLYSGESLSEWIAGDYSGQELKRVHRAFYPNETPPKSRLFDFGFGK